MSVKRKVDRPGRQSRHARPPGGTGGAANNQRRSAGLARVPRRLVPEMPPSQMPHPPILQLPVGLGIGTHRILGSDAPKALALVSRDWLHCPVSRNGPRWCSNSSKPSNITRSSGRQSSRAPTACGLWGGGRGFYAWITLICWSWTRIALVVTANSSASRRTMSSTLTPSRERPNQRRRTSANGISNSAANARASRS